MNKILVTGGCGFVGRHLIDRLLQNPENKVVCVDNLSSLGSFVKDEWFRNSYFCLYREDCLEFFNKNTDDFDEIYHLAAVVGGRRKIDFHPLQVALNLSIDYSMFIWASKHIKNTVYYFSSSAVYPVSFQTKESQIKLKEDFVNFNNNSLGIPDQTYGWSKLTGEFLAHKFVNSFDKQVVIFRPFSGFGEDQSLDYPIPSLAKRVVKAIKDGLDEVCVWGSGEQVRDFVYIDDVIDVIFGLKNYDTNPFIINIGSGNGLSFNDVILFFCDYFCKNLKIKPLLDKPTGVFYRVADVTKQKQYNVAIPKENAYKGFSNVISFYKKISKI